MKKQLTATEAEALLTRIEDLADQYRDEVSYRHGSMILAAIQEIRDRLNGKEA